jgi:hypothetical protein
MGDLNYGSSASVLCGDAATCSGMPGLSGIHDRMSSVNDLSEPLVVKAGAH